MTIDLATPWCDVPIVVIDFETTGPDPDVCEPVEVAAVRFERGEVCGAYASLLRPSCPIPEQATAIHGITDAMVANAPTLIEVAVNLANVAHGATPCAYNEVFDRTILHRFISGTDVPLFDPRVQWLDVYVVAASHKRGDRYVRGKGRLKLPAVCARHGVRLDSAHRAAGDAEAAGRLLYRLMGASRAPLAKVLQRMAQARGEQDADYAAFRQRIARKQA